MTLLCLQLPDRTDMMPPPRHLPSMRSRKRSKNQNKEVPVRSHSESPHMSTHHGSEPELRKAGSTLPSVHRPAAADESILIDREGTASSTNPCPSYGQ
ncbi:hypothetical protein LSAT2_023521 [Lamellibrachia satsuma]|nr:hypothetical protein LSAT2_023521 [Lamellibrachia satsuma]